MTKHEDAQVVDAVGSPLEPTVRRLATACEGACEEHDGSVIRVRVFHEPSGTDWGVFHYCAAARAEDEARGLLVVEEKL